MVLRLQAQQTVQKVAQRPAKVFQISLCFAGSHPDIVRLQPACAHAFLQSQQINQGRSANIDRSARPAAFRWLRQLRRIDPPQLGPQFITVINFVKSMTCLPLLPPWVGDSRKDNREP
ncbi:hypothetical protein LI87_0118010 [Stenotrophomonas maltophilia]|nr:hypothetical protein LI87_0118010 [Stenotrophomonas maltophilia]